MSAFVGFVGLGRMGRLMAANLAGSFDLKVYNRTPSVATEFASRHGVVAAESLAELTAAEVIVSMLADGPALVSVYEGLLPYLKPGTLAIDMGTSGPEAVAAVRELIEPKGVTLVDAPVSGSTAAAEAATLLIMVGGTEETFAKAQPVLASIGHPELVGPPGAGAALKLTVNSILYALNQAFAEGVALAEASGVSPAITHDIVSRSAAGAPMIGYRRAQYLEPDTSPITFTLDLAAKDIRLALEAAAVDGIRMYQLERTLETVEELIQKGLGDKDMGFVVQAARQPGLR